MNNLADFPQQGDAIVRFDLRSATDHPFSLDKSVGRPLVLFFFADAKSDESRGMIRAFQAIHARLREMGVTLAGIGIASAESIAELAAAESVTFPLLTDEDASISIRYGAAQHDDETHGLLVRRMTLVFDANYRLGDMLIDDPSPADHAGRVIEDVHRIAFRESQREMIAHAPVLLLRNVMPADLRRQLMDCWEADNEESGFMREVDGKTVAAIDYGHKIRRDHFVPKAGPLNDRIKTLVGTRVIPEIFKAFCFRVTRFEDFRIACYDSTVGGYFRAHRDNTTAGTAHRRFAMSLLLNDDYEGGMLRFPEFARHTYRPAAGDAVVFSCSLLHEATDVTAGRRFVMLSFFYGEAEARLREEYAKRTGGAYQA